MDRSKGRRTSSQSPPPRGSPTSGEGRISLRVDQPVEGCEVTTHAFYRSSEGDIDDADFQLRFCWMKSQSKRSCANKQCRRLGDGNVVLLRATVDCAICLKLGNGMENARFCTLECFRLAWGQHKQLHAPVPKANKALMDKEQLAMAPPPLSPEKWSLLKHAKTYTPTTADVGHILRVECTPMFRTGEECGPPKFVETNIVLPFPPMAPKRQMIPSRIPADRQGALRHLGGFRVLSYNVLAEIYATRQMYPYCPLWALNWSFRKQLLQRELQQYNADILCLQEVQADHYKNYFQPMMAEWGYDGLFQQKTRESMGLAGKVDGCALFYRKSRFFLKEQYAIEFNDAANEFVSSLWTNFELAYPTATNQERETFQASISRIRQRLVRDNIAQVVVLDVVPIHNDARKAQTLPSISVTNVHIFSNPEFPDVKLWQTHTLLKQLEHLAHTRRLPVIVCGDFNSEPTSAVYDLLTRNHVPIEHPDLKHLADVLHTTKLTHAMNLHSAYASVFGAEPEYTNYTGNWVGVVDYIWFSAESLTAIAGLQVHPPEVLQSYARTHLPNCQYVSDHVPICADFCFKLVNNGRY